ncbi:MAG: NUDIX hydrolase [Alphaproteobacteria bacterium]|nr:NUDIX hydrolase [Alphaproteobacteria bacterium]MCB9692698.1 NUDIX hydrolase [Alphaproteobacteria bacterium]
MNAPTHPATTILLLRPASTASGMEVFMVQRHRRSGFLPSAWVFPGGRVDPQDALPAHPAIRGGDAAMQALAQDPEVARATLLAGVRETWEEAGIWLGDPEPPESTRGPLHRGELGFAELLEQHGARVDLDRVVPWSWWITPRAEPRRYDTRFLVARAAGGGRHDDVETTDSRWICPSEAVELGQEGFPTAPPTWWSLVELATLGASAVEGAVDAVFAAAPTRPVRAIEPMMLFSDVGMRLVLPGNPAHPEPAIEGLPHEVRMVDRRWRGFEGGTITV